MEKMAALWVRMVCPIVSMADSHCNKRNVLTQLNKQGNSKRLQNFWALCLILTRTPFQMQEKAEAWFYVTKPFVQANKLSSFPCDYCFLQNQTFGISRVLQCFWRTLVLASKLTSSNSNSWYHCQFNDAKKKYRNASLGQENYNQHYAFGFTCQRFTIWTGVCNFAYFGPGKLNLGEGSFP